MIRIKDKRKFRRRGRQAAFARFAGVHESAVSQWLRGKSPSARLDRLARAWDPQSGLSDAVPRVTQAA